MPMKAIVCTKYGSPEVLRLTEVARPVPGDGEVLVKVTATVVTAADCMMRRADPFYGRLFLGLLRPRAAIVGTGFAGEIEAVGAGVTAFAVGDRVYGETGTEFGANAEFVRMPAGGTLARIPAGLGCDEAAPICDGPLTSWNFLREVAGLRAGQRVLINGAAGSLGTAAVQIARHLGAEVTGVCGPANLELVAGLGAGRVIDYTREDFTAGGPAYDIIFDTVGKSSFGRCRRALADDGVYMSAVLSMPLLLQSLLTAKSGGRKARFAATGLKQPAELRAMLAELEAPLVSGALKMVIDRRYPLEQVPAAHAYVETGHKRGSVVIDVG